VAEPFESFRPGDVNCELRIPCLLSVHPIAGVTIDPVLARPEGSTPALKGGQAAKLLVHN
jgi:hypothetical protein